MERISRAAIATILMFGPPLLMATLLDAGRGPADTRAEECAVAIFGLNLLMGGLLKNRIVWDLWTSGQLACALGLALRVATHGPISPPLSMLAMLMSGLAFVAVGKPAKVAK